MCIFCKLWSCSDDTRNRTTTSTNHRHAPHAARNVHAQTHVEAQLRRAIVRRTEIPSAKTSGRHEISDTLGQYHEISIATAKHSAEITCKIGYAFQHIYAKHGTCIECNYVKMVKHAIKQSARTHKSLSTGQSWHFNTRQLRVSRNTDSSTTC